jgi:Zn-dependent protease
MVSRWSWKLGDVSGIGIYLHWTFFLVPLLVALSALSAGIGVAAAVESVLFVLAIFGCVALHELGHALMARRFGIGTRDITLYPIGGVARLDRMPRRPAHELLIALAGPAVNVIIALAVLAGMLIAANLGLIQSAVAASSSFLGKLMFINVALVVFNMLPAFPMDGGRVLRAILAWNVPYVQATAIAATVGQVLAVLMGIGGLLLSNVSLLLIGLFVYFAAAAESQQARQRVADEPIQPDYERPPVTAPFQTVQADSQVENVAGALLSSPHHVFAVMAGARYIGVLFKGDVLRALANGLGHLRVGDLAHSR